MDEILQAVSRQYFRVAHASRVLVSRLAETIFSCKVRDCEDAVANTRDARATRRFRCAARTLRLKTAVVLRTSAPTRHQ
jgi:citrate lyase beta subunit